VAQAKPFERQLVAKVFRPQPDAASMLARFERERSAITALARSGASDPGLAAIHDAGLTRDGRPYVLMQYIDGVSIDEAARGLALEARVGLVRQCCVALVHAHEAGLVHQDITPRNVLVSKRRDGSLHVTLIDFGLAASAGTRAMLQGTPDWMAPEQSALGGAPISPATDVWALGRLLRMLVEVEAPDEDPRTEPLRALAARCMGTSPDERPRDAAALLAELDATLRHIRRAEPRRRRMRMALAVLALAPLLAAAGIFIARLGDPRWRDVPADAVEVIACDFDAAAGLALPAGWEPRNKGVGMWALARTHDGDGRSAQRVLVGEGTDGAHAHVAIPLSTPIVANEPFWLEWTMRVRPPVESSGRRDESDLLVILLGERHWLTFQPKRESLVISRSASDDPPIAAARDEVSALGFARHDAWVRFRIARAAGRAARFTIERTDLASGTTTVAELTLPEGADETVGEILLAVQERQPLEISTIRLAQRPLRRDP
jgi:serine/threonine protein kinase